MRILFYLLLNFLGLLILFNNFEYTAQAKAENEINYKLAVYKTIKESTQSQVKVSRVHSSTKSVDIREVVLEKYFENSPLSGTAHLFVEACDYYGAPRDCVTVAAIAKHETDLCRYYTSAQYYNCWGFGGPGIYRTRFNSFRESIFKVTDVLVNQYGNEYMIDPRKMEKVFCGPQDECIGWGSRIIYFMNQINNLSISMGYAPLYSLR
ncbi:MAG: hypothetical protein KatS3mg085_594 [Candidatus Dojkabacteria bacterium]|nr:MAG: hypothetical protein KatS3mg085_594 [Candidatus Dojkabacteria bacterium]